MNVLIVEDNEDSRNLLAKMLRAYGHEVTAAEDGVEALELALKAPPDIVVSDILMPRMDGYKLCYEWKQNERLKDIPFVFYTATYTSSEDEKFGLSLGASLFIRKSIEPEALAKVLSQVFEQAQKGQLPTAEAILPKPSLYLTEYNKRLVAKLNEKVAELEGSEEELRYLSSVLGAIRNINQLIVREQDKAKLLKDACKILLKVREYRFVWVGLIEEGHKRVIPVARAGVEDGYLDSVKITWDDSQSGRGPTGTAIKTRKPDLIKNIPENPRAVSWREEALKRGYRSSLSIPLIHGDKVYGALNVYSSQPDGFNDTEVGLLVEVSGDLGFALKAIEGREARQRAEEELRESEEKFFKAFHASSNLMGIATIKTARVIDINKAYARLTGYTRKEIIGHSSLELNIWAKPEQRKEVVRRLKEKGTVHDFEVEIGTKSGDIRTVLFSADTITLKGEPCLINMAIDITERKKAEEALADEATRHRILIDQSRDGIVILDENAKVYEANQRFCEMLGYTPEEVRELHTWDWDTEFPREQLLEMGRNVDEAGLHLETRHRRKDGTTIDVEISINGAMCAGQKLIFCVGRDITERKKAEEKQRTILKTALDGFWLANLEGKFIEVNDSYCKMMGYTREELFGMSTSDIEAIETPEETIRHINKVIEQGYDRFESQHKRKDGQIIDVEVSVNYLGGGEGQLFVFVRDVTERKQAEKELRESEAFQSGLLANSPIPICVVNPDNSVRFVNPALVKLTGFSAEELTGEKAPYSYWAEESPTQTMKGFKKAMRYGGDRMLELFKRKNGERFWVEITSVPVRKDGKLQYLLTHWVDITKRKQAEEALRESEAFQSGLLSNSPIPISVVNPDGSLRYVSPALERLTGYSAKELIGRKPPYPYWPEERRQEVMKGFKRAMRQGGRGVEELYKNKSGEKFWVELTTTPVRKDGKFQYLLANWVDITERKQAEEALRESEARYRAVIEGAHDMIQSVGLDGCIIFANKSWLDTLGYTEAELSSLNLFEIIHPDSLAHCQELFADVMSGKSVHGIEAAFLTKDGRKILVEGNAAPRYIGSEVVASQGIFRDVTERKQAEEALRESEAFQSGLLSNSPIPISVVNPDGSLRYVSPALERLTGYSAKELIGRKPPYPYWPEEKRQEVMKGFKRAMRQGGRGVEELYKNKSGEKFWVELTTTPVRKDGKFQYLLANWVDITERKRAEEALTDEATRHRILIDESSDGIVILDESGKVFEANRRFAEMLGYTPEEARELNVWDWEFQFPREQVVDMIANIGPEGDHFETRHRRKDGTVFDVEISTNGAVYAGQKLIFCVCRDITERKRAEEALKESEEKYKTLVETTSDIIWEVDAEGLFSFVSPKIKDLLGYEVDEVVGKKRTLDLIAKGEFRRLLRRFKEINAKREPFFGLEIPHLHKNGSLVICEVSGIPLLDSAGNFKGYVGIDKDITERRQMQEQLVIADRLASVGELAAGIAHELNNPLTGVIGFSQLLLDKDMPEDIREDLQVVYSEAQRASQVVKNLLTFARKHTAVKEKVNINDVINKVLELRAYEQNLESITVDARLDPELPEVMADYFQLQQVFLNIIINAEYFMKETNHKGNLTITTEKVGNKIKASFADDGPGIAEDALGHLFDPFFTTKEVGRGTGLGLSICHGIIAEHGGRIYVKSEPGKGATFIVELPLGAAGKKEGPA